MGYERSDITILYHNIFDYPLTKAELSKWKVAKGVSSLTSITSKDGFYFLKGREEIIKKRLQKEKYSKKKLKIAQKASKLISKIPSVLFVGITGALAMNNAGKNSDIDLIVVTKQNTLWLTRLVILVILFLLGIPIRRAGENEQRDKLCLNMWLDKTDLVWPKKDRNIYTAHEIAQIVPLVNKQKTYEKFLWKNKWILDFWPSAIGREYIGTRISYIAKNQYAIYNILYTFLNKFAFKIQYFYMRNKITREIVTPTRAIFHPTDWGKKVLKKLLLV